MNKKKVYLASPRGFCAGVERAIDVVELSLELYGAPLYVKHAIVHNTHVIKRLEKKGVCFTDDIDSIPEKSHVVFSAHGSPPEHYEQARLRNLDIIDATCPLVTKVHLEVKRFSQLGYNIIMVGHKGHVEPVGTLGNAKNVKTCLVDSLEDVQNLQLTDTDKLAIVTQTTLSLSETAEILDALKEKFPKAEFPKKQDICYATTNRQEGVGALLPHIDIILVIGSTTSSNSMRLSEMAERQGKKGYLLEDVSELKDEWLDGVSSIGISSGASAPEDLVQDLLCELQKRGFELSNGKQHGTEDVFFALPHDLVGRAKQSKHQSSILQKHTIEQGRTMKV